MSTIVAIGAHTGDAQLTGGLLLAKRALQGDRVVIVDITTGEKGAPPDVSPAEFLEINRAGAQAFAESLGGISVQMGVPDGEVYPTKELTQRLVRVLRTYQPDTVICHWKNSTHRDHVAASQLSRDAIFLASLKKHEMDLPAAPIQRILYAENWEDPEGFQPYQYFSVTEAFPVWKDAIKKLFLAEHSPYFQYLRYYEALSILRGALINVPYGVAFDIDAENKRLVER